MLNYEYYHQRAIMQPKKTFLIFYILSTLTFLPIVPYQAVVVVPVVDLIGQPIHAFYPKIATIKAYHMIPLCAGDMNRWIGCPRIHQLLYNERVEIIETRGQEVKVRICNLFYVTMKSKKEQTEYWAPRNAFMALDDLIKEGIDTRSIPDAIDFTKKTAGSSAIVTLTMPHHDSKTGIVFSAGTRFVRAKNKKTLSPDSVSAIVYDAHHKKNRTIKLPAHICFVQNDALTPAEQRAAFVSLVKQWAHMCDGFIPYVWGGCSVIHTNTGNFKEKTRKQMGKTVSYFTYKGCQQKICTGLDCTGLIARAAQIVGMPYFYKNSYTIGAYMPPLQLSQHLSTGDIVWLSGHAMVVTDVASNLMVEARSYFQGYGKVHEIELSKVFKDITTYTDLEEAFFAKRPLARMDSKGIVRLPLIKDYKLLPLASIWSI
jgi:cell wall-associated NlpC family hydrolase